MSSADYLQNVSRLARRRRAWQLAAATGVLAPSDVTKIQRWYRLAISTPVSSEYPSVTEAFGGSAIAQTDADRKPVAATSANSLPVATFDGTDVWLQTLETGNNGTAKWWTALRVKPADFGGSQALHYIMGAGASGLASSNRTRLFLNSATGVPVFDILTSAAAINGRRYTAGTALTAAVWNHLYVQWDNTRTAECDTDGLTEDAKLRLFLGNTALALTASDMGTGGTPSALLSATGSAIIGGSNDSDTPVAPLRNGGQLGPNWFFGSEPLTALELALLNAFEVPT